MNLTRAATTTDPDDLNVEIQELTPEEICELLGEQGAELSPEQAVQLAQLVAECGGIEEALAALEQLSTR